MDDFRVHISVGPGDATVFVAGELDAATAPALDEALRTIEAEGTGDRDLVIDLAEVSFIDSSGLSVLVAAHKRRRSAGAPLIVARPNPSTRRLFSIAGLDSILTVREAPRPAGD